MEFTPRIPPITRPPIRLAVCVSGGGTTLQNLIDRTKIDLDAEIALVIADRTKIKAIDRANAAGIPLYIIKRSAYSATEFHESIYKKIRQHKIDLIILGGFLSLMRIPPDYARRVINIHPALIPSFCGEGYYGHHVHEAVLASGVTKSGCTVHFADDHYDSGPIILQREVPVLSTDTADILAARVFVEECKALPEAIELYAAGRL